MGAFGKAGNFAKAAQATTKGAKAWEITKGVGKVGLAGLGATAAIGAAGAGVAGAKYLGASKDALTGNMGED